MNNLYFTDFQFEMTAKSTTENDSQVLFLFSLQSVYCSMLCAYGVLCVVHAMFNVFQLKTPLVYGTQHANSQNQMRTVVRVFYCFSFGFQFKLSDNELGVNVNVFLEKTSNQSKLKR